MCGFASRTASAAIGFEPAIDGPPVWNVTVMPCCFAQRDHRRGLGAGLDAPEADLADERDATRGHLGEVVLLEPELEDRRAGLAP